MGQTNEETSPSPVKTTQTGAETTDMSPSPRQDSALSEDSPYDDDQMSVQPAETSDSSDAASMETADTGAEDAMGDVPQSQSQSPPSEKLGSQGDKTELKGANEKGIEDEYGTGGTDKIFESKTRARDAQTERSRDESEEEEKKDGAADGDCDGAGAPLSLSSGAGTPAGAPPGSSDRNSSDENPAATRGSQNESRENVTRPINDDEPELRSPPTGHPTSGTTAGQPHHQQEGRLTSRSSGANTEQSKNGGRHEGATHVDVERRQEEEGEPNDHNPAGAAEGATSSASAANERPDPPARSSSSVLETKAEPDSPALRVDEGELSEEARSQSDAGGDSSPAASKTRTSLSEPTPSLAVAADTSKKAEVDIMSSTEVLTMSSPETPAVPKTLVLSPPSPEPSEERASVDPEGSNMESPKAGPIPVASLSAPFPAPETLGSVAGSIHDDAQTLETSSTMDVPLPTADHRQRSISFSDTQRVMPAAPVVMAQSPALQRSAVSNLPQQMLQQQAVFQVPVQQHPHQLQPQMAIQQSQMAMQQPQMAMQQSVPMNLSPNKQRMLEMQQSFLSTTSQAPPPGRRKIHFRLMEEVNADLTEMQRQGSTRKLFQKFRRKIRSTDATDVSVMRGYGSTENLRTLDHRSSNDSLGGGGTGRLIDRGSLVVSWYDGTGSAELQEHVMNSASRKLGLGKRMVLEDVMIIDDAVEPHEEIVLCPYIPDGSRFVLKFRVKDTTVQSSPPPLSREASDSRYGRQESVYSRAPESPSAAPSPFPSVANLEQLQMLLDKAQQERRAQTAPTLPPLPPLPPRTDKERVTEGQGTANGTVSGGPVEDLKTKAIKEEPKTPGTEEKKKELSEEDLVLKRLNQLNELLTNGNVHRRQHAKEEKKQVIFVLANYFVLFLSLIAISAEIHERAGGWMEWLNSHLDSIQTCSADRDALYECVSEGNFSGLVAAFVFWVTRSAATKNILLFGFDTPQKLWTVVYEAGVSAVCWGTSYMFIRRGLNPDTRPNFLHKYWKDCVYGSLAGFNAAFMKAVLKNLLPQDQVLDVLENRQLRIVDWISHIFISRES